MEKLLRVISNVGPATDGLKGAIAKCAKMEVYKKNAVLLKEGHVCRHIHFIEEGLARAFYYKDQKEYTSWFMDENNLIISVFSFFSQKPSYENIQLLEDSSIVSLDYDNLQQLYRQYPEFNYIGRILTEQYYTISEERTKSLRTLSAHERYIQLMEVFPSLFNRVPLQYIASYLGMSRETLSRIRAE